MPQISVRKMLLLIQFFPRFAVWWENKLLFILINLNEPVIFLDDLGLIKLNMPHPFLLRRPFTKY